MGSRTEDSVKLVNLAQKRLLLSPSGLISRGLRTRSPWQIPSSFTFCRHNGTWRRKKNLRKIHLEEPSSVHLEREENQTGKGEMNYGQHLRTFFLLSLLSSNFSFLLLLIRGPLRARDKGASERKRGERERKKYWEKGWKNNVESRRGWRVWELGRKGTWATPSACSRTNWSACLLLLLLLPWLLASVLACFSCWGEY